MGQNSAMKMAVETPSVTGIAAETSKVFEPIVEEMMAVRSAASNLNKSANILAEAVSSAGKKFESNTEHCGSKLLVEIADVLRCIEALEDVCSEQDVRKFCDQIIDQTKELSACTSLTLIVTVQVEDNEIFDRVVFTRDVRELCQRLKRAVKNVGTALASYRNVRSGILDHLDAARGDLTGALAGSKTKHDADAENAARRALEEVASLQENVNGEMRSLVACMQHPDAFRQRAEHVDAMLEMTTTLSDTEATSVSTLAGAHCRDMAEELAEIVNDAQRALETMAAGSSKTSNQFAQTISVETRIEHINAQRAAVGAIIASVAKTKQNTSEALQGLDTMKEKVVEVGDLLRSLIKDRDAVHCSSLNAEIAARHLGERTKGMSTVASATRETAMSCAMSIEGLTDLFRSLLKATEAIDSSGLREAFAGLEAAMDDDQSLLSKALETGEVISAAAREAKGRMVELASTARSAAKKLEDLKECVLKTDDTANVLASEEAVTLPDEVASQIVATYTMERERATHRTIFPKLDDAPISEQATTSHPAEEPDLASVLF